MTIREMWAEHPWTATAVAIAAALALVVWMKWSGDRAQALMDAYAPVHEQAAAELDRKMQIDPTCWDKEDK